VGGSSERRSGSRGTDRFGRRVGLDLAELQLAEQQLAQLQHAEQQLDHRHRLYDGQRRER